MCKLCKPSKPKIMGHVSSHYILPVKPCVHYLKFFATCIVFHNSTERCEKGFNVKYHSDVKQGVLGTLKSPVSHSEPSITHLTPVAAALAR